MDDVGIIKAPIHHEEEPYRKCGFHQRLARRAAGRIKEIITMADLRCQDAIS
jgi:hypothetical protein